jgi:hypothetical protein
MGLSLNKKLSGQGGSVQVRRYRFFHVKSKPPSLFHDQNATRGSMIRWHKMLGKLNAKLPGRRAARTSKRQNLFFWVLLASLRLRFSSLAILKCPHPEQFSQGEGFCVGSFNPNDTAMKRF